MGLGQIALMLGLPAGLIVVALAAWRFADHRADRTEMARLCALAETDPPLFDAAALRGLPEPAQRFFRFAIAPGTPLRRVARIHMTGTFGLGDKSRPGYLPMRATQVLAAPDGFVWKMSAGQGARHISGSDSGRWTRFWLAGLIPVARRGGDADHARAAFGRYVAEAVFWTPAAVLPGPGVAWSPLGPDSARVTVRQGELEQSVDLTVDETGRPTVVRFLRWSDANPDGVYRLQPFGGQLSRFRAFEGFCLPTHVVASNMFGETDAFAFFKADVTAVSFRNAAHDTCMAAK